MSTIQEDIALYQRFFHGEKTYIYTDFITRKTDDTVEDADLITEEAFKFQNIIRDIINERVSFMPTDFTVSVKKKGSEDEDEEAAAFLNEWRRERNCGARTFDGSVTEYYEAHEVSGTIYLKLYTDGEAKIKVRRWYSEGVYVATDPLDFNRVTGYIFEYDMSIFVDETIEIQHYVEIVNEKEIIVKNSTTGVELSRQEHGLPFIPVVMIIRKPIDGMPYGLSGVKELIEAQQDVNDALTKRSIATTYNAFQIFAPKIEMQGSIDTTSEDKVTVKPGDLCEFPLEAVGGNVDLTPIVQEIEDNKRYIYRLAKVPRPADQEGLITNISAVALNVLKAPLRDNTEEKLVFLSYGFKELFEHILYMNDGQEYDVTVDFPPLDMEDRDYQLKAGQFAITNGYRKRGVMMGLGIDDKEFEEWEKERLEESAESLARWENQRTAMIDAANQNIPGQENPVGELANEATGNLTGDASNPGGIAGNGTTG